MNLNSIIFIYCVHFVIIKTPRPASEFVIHFTWNATRESEIHIALAVVTHCERN